MIKPDFLTDPDLVRIWDLLPEARMVGGAVRDALSGRPVSDLDLATPQPPEAVIIALRQPGIKVVPTGLAHGTVTAVTNGRAFEITTLRRDVETDGRHAIVAYTADWKLDASRRDFTINAMSMERDGHVHDHFGGIADLSAGRIRFVGDPATRIAEDYLRILRYFRFHARFGRIPPDQPTLDALRIGISGLEHLSAERIWIELRRILGASDPAESIKLMKMLGIWTALVPEALAPARLSRLPPDPILRLAAMLSGDPMSLAKRLKLSNTDRDRLARLATTHISPDSDADLRRLLADYPAADLIDLTWLDDQPEIRRRLLAMQCPVFPVKGRDLVALGLPAGPALGDLLRQLRRWWLEGGCQTDRSGCLEELARSTNLHNMDPKR